MKKSIKTQIEIFNREFPVHLESFGIPWLLIGLMLLVSFINIPFKTFSLLGLVVAFVLMLVFKPMNIIYGLIGTHGYIGLFFFLFIIINFSFSGIYFKVFFKDAGITYETNQPHVEFAMFQDTTGKVMPLQPCKEYLPPTSKDTIHTYYKTTYGWVLRNTFLTSLMQEPTDFFSAANTFTGVTQSKEDPNFAMANSFHWFLIFHIMISWILLGVFISLIYQRFRNS